MAPSLLTGIAVCASCGAGMTRTGTDRLMALLQMSAERQAAKADAIDRRLVALQREVADCEDRLRRLYR